jgi:ABC-type nitrate/sulfonate/bicarbonate transport system substrate-binding protein
MGTLAGLAAVRLALGLRSTAQSLGVIGASCGVFVRHGVDLQLVKQETSGPAGIKGLLEGEYDIAELGALPVVQAVMEGGDAVILLAAEKVAALHLLGAAGVASPRALEGGDIGVLSAAGQTGVSARQMLERWGLAPSVRITELGTYPAILRGLQEGRIAAGVLTADYGIAGAAAHGLSLLADLGQELGLQAPVVATTRRFLRTQRDVCQRIVNAYVDSIRFFKTHPHDVAALLVRHLGFVDNAQALAIHGFYAARFQDRPYASEEGLRRIVGLLANSVKPACVPQTSDFYESMLVAEAP